MKKLLSILTISTLTASVSAPLLANTTLERVKRNVGITAKDITTGFEIKTKEKLDKELELKNNFLLWNIEDKKITTKEFIIDSKENIYFGTTDGAYILKKDFVNPIQLKNINVCIKLIIKDKKNNIYFIANNHVFVLKQEKNVPVELNISFSKINDAIFDNQDNIYFATDTGLYKLNNNNNIEEKILDINFRLISFAKNSEGHIYITSGAQSKNDLVLIDNKLKEINNIKGYVYNIFVDNQDNVYFVSNKNNFYKLKKNKFKVQKIEKLIGLINYICQK
ncbi:hypothetical protein TS70_06535, partial [Spiroplasma sp. hyd1]|nr:hypothetical protein [Spiroplasma sp. hyd1]